MRIKRNAVNLIYNGAFVFPEINSKTSPLYPGNKFSKELLLDPESNKPSR